MLEDFDPKKTIDAKAKSRGVIALAIAVAGLGGLFATLIVLSQRPSEPAPVVETEVTFEDAPPVPEVEEEVAPPEPEQNFDPRPAVVREAMLAPTEIPEERPEESEADLAPIEVSGPIDGNLGGQGGRGGIVNSGFRPAIVEEEEDDDEDTLAGSHYSIEDATAPRLLDGCRAPSFPNDPTLVGQSVRVRCVVGLDGTPTCTVTSGPESARAAALECANGRRYEPARYPDGTATTYPKPITFVIGGS